MSIQLSPPKRIEVEVNILWWGQRTTKIFFYFDDGNLRQAKACHLFSAEADKVHSLAQRVLPRLMAADRVPNLLIDRRTIYHWATVAHIWYTHDSHVYNEFTKEKKRHIKI